jgi:hypothetical protein
MPLLLASAVRNQHPRNPNIRVNVLSSSQIMTDTGPLERKGSDLHVNCPDVRRRICRRRRSTKHVLHELIKVSSSPFGCAELKALVNQALRARASPAGLVRATACISATQCASGPI